MQDAKIVTDAIVGALEAGPIASSNLAPDSVSYVSFQVGEAIVHVSWYSGANPCSGAVREVIVNGEGLPVSSRQIAEIVSAAQSRAKELQREKLAFLAGRRPSS